MTIIGSRIIKDLRVLDVGTFELRVASHVQHRVEGFRLLWLALLLLGLRA